jgi:hypothetical protein
MYCVSLPVPDRYISRTEYPFFSSLYIFAMCFLDSSNFFSFCSGSSGSLAMNCTFFVGFPLKSVLSTSFVLFLMNSSTLDSPSLMLMYSPSMKSSSSLFSYADDDDCISFLFHTLFLFTECHTTPCICCQITVQIPTGIITRSQKLVREHLLSSIPTLDPRGAS